MCICVCPCVYIYIYTHTYLYTGAARRRQSESEKELANLILFEAEVRSAVGQPGEGLILAPRHQLGEESICELLACFGVEIGWSPI